MTRETVHYDDQIDDRSDAKIDDQIDDRSDAKTDSKIYAKMKATTTKFGSDPVTIVEVSPRDGLQSDATTLATTDKVELIRRAVALGVRRAEVVSFVNPKRVPQMADSVEVMQALNTPGVIGHRDRVSFAGLVLNARGLDNALVCGVDEINFVVVCTDTFAEKNQGKTTSGLIDQWHEIGAAARQAGLFTSVTFAASFGCPYEGEVSLERLESVLAAVMETPPDEIALADSIGVASPLDVRQRVGVARSVIGDAQLRCHFHNTRNTGIANAAAAVEAGVRVLDSSLGGIGGCPFAPNATGNIATEDLAYMLHRMGHDTGLDLDEACEMVPWLETLLQHSAPGLLAKAGNYPPPSLRQ